MEKELSNIITGRLLLRPFTHADLENVFKGLSHPEVIQYYGVSYSTLEETKLQMKWFAEIEQNKTGQWFAICSSDNTIFYGGCGLNNINALHCKGEIGYWLLPAFWGKGIITEALPPVIEYGFTALRLHRIEAVIETANENSKKIMHKLGFAYEGTMQECEFKNGEYISLAMYAILNSNY
jgi:[ribosomal protein S5]-alanine N-acetyltransferase